MMSSLKPAGGTAPTRLRQIALVARDLKKAREQLVGNVCVSTYLHTNGAIDICFGDGSRV